MAGGTAAPDADDVLRLRAGDFVADVTAAGGALAALTFRGTDLIERSDGRLPNSGYHGALLAPWPNRLANGEIKFSQRTYFVPVNEAQRRTALHGLVADVYWDVGRVSENSVRLHHRLQRIVGYPFTIDLTVDYVLQESGLCCRVTATNLSAAAAPFGFGVHPYLVAGSAPADHWHLTLPAQLGLELDDERGLPVADPAPLDDHLDFRRAKMIGTTRLDDTFTGIGFVSGIAVASLTAPGHPGSLIAWDHSCPWLHVFINDGVGTHPPRSSVAIEPMSMPPNALHADADRWALPAGVTSQFRWWLTTPTRLGHLLDS